MTQIARMPHLRHFRNSRLSQLLLDPEVFESPPATNPESLQTHTHCVRQAAGNFGSTRREFLTAETGVLRAHTSQTRNAPTAPIAFGGRAADTQTDPRRTEPFRNE